MKKKYFILLLLFGITGYSQAFFVEYGKNFTKFNYRNSNTTSIPLHSDLGNTLQFGYHLPLKNSNFQCAFGLQLDEFNSYVEAQYPAANYNLNYLGINNSILYSIIGSGREGGSFVLNLKGGLLLHKFISGKETIFNKNYDLNSFSEFNKTFLVATFGAQAKVLVSDSVDISLGFDRCISFLNTGNGDNQFLSFSSNQIKLGVYFILN